MRTRFHGLLWAASLCLSVAGYIHAQDEVAKPTLPDFSHDPCGNPLMESQIWAEFKGTVSKVIDGRTVLVTLADEPKTVRVRFVAISLDARTEFSAKARSFVRERALGKPVDVMTNLENWYREKKWYRGEGHPGSVVGVVFLRQMPSDIGLSLLDEGLAYYQQPRPYTMSGHTACEYRNAEQAAREKKIGQWQ